MASGGNAPQFKFFFFAQPSGEGPSGLHFLVEMQLNTDTASAALTVKSDVAAERVADFTHLIKTTLRNVQ